MTRELDLIGAPASVLSFSNSWAVLSGGMATCKREASHYSDEQEGDLPLRDTEPERTVSDTVLRAATYARTLMREFLDTSSDDLEHRRQLFERFATAVFLLRLKIRLEFAWDGAEVVTLRKGGLPRILPGNSATVPHIGFSIDLRNNDVNALHAVMLAAGVDIMGPDVV